MRPSPTSQVHPPPCSLFVTSSSALVCVVCAACCTYTCMAGAPPGEPGPPVTQPRSVPQLSIESPESSDEEPELPAAIRQQILASGLPLFAPPRKPSIIVEEGDHRCAAVGVVCTEAGLPLTQFRATCSRLAEHRVAGAEWGDGFSAHGAISL